MLYSIIKMLPVCICFFMLNIVFADPVLRTESESVFIAEHE